MTRNNHIGVQRKTHLFFYVLFALSSLVIMLYYASDTLVHFTTPRQFPISSFERFPLTWLIFPAELFSFIFGLYFVYNLIRDKDRQGPPGKLEGRPSVAILLPVYNEPKEIVERTIRACKKLRWRGNVNIYLLDDSTEMSHKRSMTMLTKKHDCTLVRREDRDGYKAGNVNNAVREVVDEPYFAIFDADQAPNEEFLEELMDYFSDEDVAFSQAPQYFINEGSLIERTAKVSANIFFHAMCASRTADDAMVFCGTNAVIRKEAFEEVGGFAYYSATEDMELGIRFTAQGYRGSYVPKVLVEGYAPRTFKAYKSQQYRWANGNLAILRESWMKILGGNFSLRQQIHTFFVLGWWLIGIVTLIYIIVPILSTTLGLGTHHTWLPHALLAWLYFHVILGIGMIYVSLKGRLSRDRITLKDAFLQYSLLTNSLFIYTWAAINAFFKRYTGFVRTEKTAGRSKLSLVKWNLLLGAITLGVSFYALYQAALAQDMIHFRTYLPVSLWLLFYGIILSSSVLFVGENA